MQAQEGGLVVPSMLHVAAHTTPCAWLHCHYPTHSVSAARAVEAGAWRSVAAAAACMLLPLLCRPLAAAAAGGGGAPAAATCCLLASSVAAAQQEGGLVSMLAAQEVCI
jgi:hypothetical protein